MLRCFQRLSVPHLAAPVSYTHLDVYKRQLLSHKHKTDDQTEEVEDEGHHRNRNRDEVNQHHRKTLSLIHILLRRV